MYKKYVCRLRKKLFTGFLGYIFFFVSLEKVSLNSHWQCCVYVSLKTSSGGIFFIILMERLIQKIIIALKTKKGIV